MAAGCRGIESTQDEVAVLPVSPVAVTVHKNAAVEPVSFTVGRRFHGPVNDVIAEHREADKRRGSNKIFLREQ